MTLIQKIKRFFQLKNKVLGINRRNISFVKKYNSASAKMISDDKILTKKVLQKANIPVPALIKVIKNRDDLKKLNFDSLPKSFVLKPVKGVGGGGIEIFFNRDEQGNLIRGDKTKISQKELRNHILDILDGRYSLGNVPDRVLIEERVKNYNNFRLYTYKGVPDVRVWVFKGVPVMSYIRWPTEESRGKANMAIGAVASGIDLASGFTTTSVKGKNHGGKGEKIEFVPGTHLRFSGVRIPYWNKILIYSIEAAKISGLGLAAVDFLIDRDRGPVIVELNARPGISIQIVNQEGLNWRLEKVKGLKVKTTEQAIRLSKDMFGGEIEEEIEAISGRQVIGLIQEIKLFSKSGKKNMVIKAKVDTGADSSSLDSKLARELGYGEAIDIFQSYKIPEFLKKEETEKITEDLKNELVQKNPDIVGFVFVHSSSGSSARIKLKIKCKIEGIEKEVEMNIRDRSNLEFSMIVGRKDLKEFLIDPRRK